MRRLDMMLAYAAGCFTAFVIAVSVAELRAQDQTTVHVCVASDGVMTLARGPQCAAGQPDLYFQKSDGAVSAPGFSSNGPSRDGGASNADTAAMTRRLNDLERGLKDLEDAARRGELSDHVVAPFVVTDRSGRRLFDVDEESGIARAQVYNSSDVGVASMWATDTGGQFIARTGPAGLAAYLGVFGGKSAGLRVLEEGKARLTVGRDADNGRYLLKLFSAGGNPVAAIGENSLGTGSVQVADINGSVKALVTVNKDGKGAFSIFNAGGKEVAYLTEGVAAGGLLSINGADGSTPMVEAGVTQDGVGIVRAGPYGFKPGLGLLGLPGSYIMGKR